MWAAKEPPDSLSQRPHGLGTRCLGRLRLGLCSGWVMRVQITASSELLSAGVRHPCRPHAGLCHPRSPGEPPSQGAGVPSTPIHSGGTSAIGGKP